MYIIKIIKGVWSMIRNMLYAFDSFLIQLLIIRLL